MLRLPMATKQLTFLTSRRLAMHRSLLLLFIAALCCLLNAPAATSAQTAETARTLTKISIPQEPVKIACVNYGRGDDWLKDLNISVENISGRRIIALEAALLIAAPALEHPLTIPLLYEKVSVTDHISIGGRAILRISAPAYQIAKERMAKLVALPAIESAQLLITRADFGNGIGWYLGSDYLRAGNSVRPIASTPLNICASQENTLTLHVIPALPPFGGKISEPIKIVQSLAPGADWLASLSIEVENISRQPIKYIELLALICDIKQTDYCVAVPLIFVADESDARSLLAPGARVKLTVSTPVYNSARELVEKFTPLVSIPAADIIIGQVYFTDGGGWHNQTLLRNFAWSVYKPGNRSFYVDKEVYVWGYLRNRESAYSDMYLGMEATRDELVLEYDYDEAGNIRAVRVKGSVRKGGGYIRSNERSKEKQ
jgi:hypothetical protein